LAYDSLSQPFFGGVLQNMHTQGLDNRIRKYLF
jgi:hypothetical protein